MTQREDLAGKEFEGRKAVMVLDIPPCGTFKSIYRAEDFLKDLGYRTGSMCRQEPIGFAYKCDYVAKWYNLSKEDKNSLDGILLPLDEFREGGVRIVFFNQPHLEG